MTAICFVCNLPIQSHQVGLEWKGGNGWDDIVREQVEESTLKQRLGKYYLQITLRRVINWLNIGCIKNINFLSFNI